VSDTMPARRGIQIGFGRVLRDRRLALGLSQEALAARADLHRNYVGEVERGAKCPSLCAVEALAEALGVRPSELVRDAE
jgi:transcriptional regulator with XRE-family HTH domain